MKKISNSAILIVTFLGVFLIGYWFLVVPELKKMKNNIIEIDKKSYPKLSQEVLVYKTDLADTNISEQTRDLALLLLPKDEKKYDLVVQIEYLVKNMNVSMTSLSLSDKEPELGPKTSVSSGLNTNNVEVGGSETNGGSISSGDSFSLSLSGSGAVALSGSLTIGGSYEGVQSFVRELCRLNRMIEINQINISGSSSEVSAQIGFLAFYLP